MEHNALMGQFVSTLLASRTQAHIYHLQTPSFAAHKALNEYYEEIVDIIDGIVESYQGKYGIITGYGNVALQEYQSCEGIIAYFTTLCMALVKVSRLTESPNHSDSVVDALAYISIYQTVLEAEADVNFTWGDD